VTDKDPDRTALAVQLVNDVDHARRKGKLARDFRLILGPLRESDATGSISAVGRLVENNKADVIRAQPGNDNPGPLKRAALVEFADEGTLAFYLAPGHWRTVAIKPRPRARIVGLAKRFSNGKRSDRGARLRRRHVTHGRT
jgi:hypothetical protein